MKKQSKNLITKILCASNTWPHRSENGVCWWCEVTKTVADSHGKIYVQRLNAIVAKNKANFCERKRMEMMVRTMAAAGRASEL